MEVVLTGGLIFFVVCTRKQPHGCWLDMKHQNYILMGMLLHVVHSFGPDWKFHKLRPTNLHEHYALTISNQNQIIHDRDTAGYRV